MYIHTYMRVCVRARACVRIYIFTYMYMYMYVYDTHAGHWNRPKSGHGKSSIKATTSLLEAEEVSCTGGDVLN
jgi:hypothetical protein